MIQDEDDEVGQPLSARSFIKWIDEEMISLTDALVATGKKEEEYSILRGRVLALRKAKTAFLNKKDK